MNNTTSSGVLNRRDFRVPLKVASLIINNFRHLIIGPHNKNRGDSIEFSHLFLEGLGEIPGAIVVNLVP